MKHEIEVRKNLIVTDEDIDDIMSSALDSIGYWATEAKVEGGKYLGEYASEQIARNGALLILEEDETTPKRLDKASLLNGIRMWYEEGYDQYDAVQADGTLDCGMIDGEMADIIVQFALFSEIVYG